MTVTTLDLVFPPFTGATYPYLSLPALAAYVRRTSDHEVNLRDLNLDMIRWLLSEDNLSSSLRRAKEALDRLSGLAKLEGRLVERYEKLLTACTRGPAIIGAIGAALKCITSLEGVNDPTAIALADAIMQDALALCVADAEGDVLNFTSARYRYSEEHPDELRAGILDERHIFWRSYIALIGANDFTADVIGLSVVFKSQVFPALVLARWLRLNRPRARIIVGGPFFTFHRDRLKEQPWLFDLVDAFVVHEGEGPLTQYLDTVNKGSRTVPIPGIVERRADGKLLDGGPPPPLDVNSLPTPDFQGLELERYLSPSLVLPLLASRGCYWSCAFCTHHHIYGDSYRVRKHELLKSDVDELVKRFGARAIYFVDESVSPSLLGKITAAASGHPGVSWGCEIRMERALTPAVLKAAFASGCRVMSFGMESAVDRVLTLMGKGVQRADLERVLTDCAVAGIHPHIMCIIGFPGESEDEAHSTANFCASNAGFIDLLGFSLFALQKHAPIYKLPENYGVSIRPLDRAGSLCDRVGYTSHAGMTMERAFDVWEGIVADPRFRELFARIGHGERERLLFSRGHGYPKPAPQSELRATLNELPIISISTSFDWSEIVRQSKQLARNRAQSEALQGSWVDLDAPIPSVAHREQVASLMFSPTNWDGFLMEGATARIALMLG
jgi:anaerobic magnesium-protoporphyrin IX monomethyl ester cyclase